MSKRSVSGMGVMSAAVMACVAAASVSAWNVRPACEIRMTAAALAQVRGGQGTCYVKQTLGCPATTASCVGACTGKQVGDPCADQSYVQYAPAYKRAKLGTGGQKALTTPVAKLCGVTQHCGPQCLVSALIGLHCPIGTVKDYELQTEPIGPNCDAG